MTQEEKAKRYDVAIKKAESLYRAAEPMSGCNVIIETIFPELKESIDERVKKVIKQVLSESTTEKDECYLDNGVTQQEVFAWLEKQGETFTKRDIDDAYLKGVINTKNATEKQYEANYQIRKDIATFIFNYRGDIKDRAKWLDYLGIKVSLVEKQGEQKPAWSEEDGKNLEQTIWYVEKGGKLIFAKTDKLVSWLKSIKDRVQPQNLTVTDEELAQAKKDAYNDALDKIEYHSGEPTFDDGWSAAIWYLKKRNIQPQPKQEWSEEDEKT